jgi:hypothetical protein
MKKLTKKQQAILSATVSSAIGRMVVLGGFVSNMVKTKVVETKLNMDEIVARFILVNTLFEMKKVVVKKSVQARIIFQEMYDQSILSGTKMVRKDVIARFMAECGLTRNGAATYVQNIKKEHGLIGA